MICAHCNRSIADNEATVAVDMFNQRAYHLKCSNKISRGAGQLSAAGPALCIKCAQPIRDRAWERTDAPPEGPRYLCYKCR